MGIRIISKFITTVLVVLIVYGIFEIGSNQARAQESPAAHVSAENMMVLAQDTNDSEDKQTPYWQRVIGAIGMMNPGNPLSVVAVGSSVVAPVAAEKIQGLWKGQVGKFVESLVNGNAEMMATTLTMWTGYSFDPRVGASNISGVRNIVAVLTVAALIISLIIGGLRLAAVRATGLDDGFKDIGAVILRLMVATSLVPVLTVGGMAISDSLANQIMEQFGPSDMTDLIGLADASGIQKVFGPIVVMVVLLLAVCGSAMQFLALAVRFIVVPIAAGLAPLFAAGSMTSTGKNGLSHLYAYLVAAVVYKPVAALLYVMVFWWNQGIFGAAGEPDSEDTGQWVSKLLIIVMLGMVGFSAPALIKIITPAAAPSAGSSGAGAAGVMAGVAGMATGAVAMAAGVVSGGTGTLASLGAQKASGSSTTDVAKTVAEGTNCAAGGASGSTRESGSTGGAGIAQGTESGQPADSAGSTPIGDSQVDSHGSVQEAADPASSASTEIDFSAADSNAEGSDISSPSADLESSPDGASQALGDTTSSDNTHAAPSGAQRQEVGSPTGDTSAAGSDTDSSREESAPKGSATTPTTPAGSPGTEAQTHESLDSVSAQPAPAGESTPPAAPAGESTPPAAPVTQPIPVVAPISTGASDGRSGVAPGGSQPTHRYTVPDAGEPKKKRQPVRTTLRWTSKAAGGVRKASRATGRGAHGAAQQLGQIGASLDAQAGGAPQYFGQIHR